MKTAIVALATLHLAVITFNTASIVILLAAEPLYVSLPLSTLLLRIWFQGRCPLTLAENALRRRAGMPEIESFKRHYLFARRQKAGVA